MKSKEEILSEKKGQLKRLKSESKRAARSGRHNWGDYHRRQHISTLEKEIRSLQST